MYFNDTSNNFNNRNDDFDYLPKSSNKSNDPIGIGTWILILIGLGLPFVNIILLLILGFAVDNISLNNFARASLIIMVVGLLIRILLN